MSRHKFRLIILCLILSNNSAFSQELSVSHNLDESLAMAKQEKKNVLMIFSGSDWCKPCIQLRKNIIETRDFISFADENLVILELDFPYSRKNKLPKEQSEHNEALADLYNEEGSFPKMILLDYDQRTLGIVPYQKKDNTQKVIQALQKLATI